MYLDEHPETKGNGFYTRSLITKFGALDNLKVPRVREGDFKRHLSREL
ncbi:MAG TPA: IS256 family transposase, partial [Thermodesulfobacterium commune]|nr:IS256 family transposase [Thermodesulfobacterium commune]